MADKAQKNVEVEDFSPEEIARTFIPPEGWVLCSGSCGEPIPASAEPNKVQCLAGSCSEEGCECRLFRGRGNYPDAGYTWEHVADQGEWASKEDRYWYICICAKRA